MTASRRRSRARVGAGELTTARDGWVDDCSTAVADELGGVEEWGKEEGGWVVLVWGEGERRKERE